MNGMSDEVLVSAVWERRIAAHAGGEPLEMAYADLAAAGLAFVGTEAQRRRWAALETAWEDGAEE